MHKLEGFDAGIEGVIPGSSSITRVFNITNDWVRVPPPQPLRPPRQHGSRRRRTAAHSQANLRAYVLACLQIDNEIGVEMGNLELGDMGKKIRGNFWKFKDMSKIMQLIFKHFEIDKLDQKGVIYIIKIAADGAPTAKYMGLVTLSLVLVDPRTNEEIRYKPQSKKHCFPIAGYLGKESYGEMDEAFGGILAELREMVDTGGLVMIDGTTVQFDFCHGLDLSAVWHSTTDCGGAIGTSFWPCPWCEWTADWQACGDLLGCSECKCECPHRDQWSPEKKVKLLKMRDDLLVKLNIENTTYGSDCSYVTRVQRQFNTSLICRNEKQVRRDEDRLRCRPFCCAAFRHA